jgi:NAD(P)-dependent dehydrogenase (short-subunit alcohol dehydrogenase family)
MSWTDKKFLLVGSKGNLGPIWKETIEGEGGTVFTFDPPENDVTDSNSITEYLNKNRLSYLSSNNVDVVLYNAAIDNPPGSQASFFGNMYNIMDVNLMGAMKVASSLIPVMAKRGGGTFIFIGSIMGYIGADWRNYPDGFEKPVAYGLSKAALIGLARSITVQYGRQGIRACVLAFGPYDGGQLPEDFKGKFLKNVPLGRTISRKTLEASLRFAVDAPEFARDVLCDAGYTAW